MIKIKKHIVILTVSVFFLSLVSIFSRLLFPISGYINTFFGYTVVLLLTIFWLISRNSLRKIKLKGKKKEMIFLALG